MPSEEDKIADGINKPLLGVALAIVAIGILLCITIALLPLGLIVTAIGVIWALALFISAKAQAKTMS